MTPAQKKKQKKEKKKKESVAETARKWKALAMLSLSILGYGAGKGAVEAMQHQREVPSVSAPVPNKPVEQWNYSAPQQENLPTGGEPKQRLRFIYVNDKGDKQTFSSEASVRSLAYATYGWGTKPAFVQPKEGDDGLVINAQFHRSAPMITLNIARKDIPNHIATLGDSSLSAKDLESVRHITISPETNPEKPAKA